MVEDCLCPKAIIHLSPLSIETSWHTTETTLAKYLSLFLFLQPRGRTKERKFTKRGSEGSGSRQQATNSQPPTIRDADSLS